MGWIMPSRRGQVIFSRGIARVAGGQRLGDEGNTGRIRHGRARWRNGLNIGVPCSLGGRQPALARSLD